MSGQKSRKIGRDARTGEFIPVAEAKQAEYQRHRDG